jgi:hypothetical protein
MRWAAYVAHKGESRDACRIWWGNRSESNHLDELGKTTLKFIFKKLDGSVDEIDLAHTRDRLRALVEAVIKTFRIHNMRETY